MTSPRTSRTAPATASPQEAPSAKHAATARRAGRAANVGGVTPNPNFDVTPNPRAVAQLVPDRELVEELYHDQDAELDREAESAADLFLPAGADAAWLEELAAACAERASTYAFLARIYQVEVDQPLLDQLVDTRYPASTGIDEVDQGNLQLATYLSNVWENTVTELAIDYVRAFIGHNGNHISAAYPFESVYRSEKQLLMQEARDEVLALYRAAGLTKQESWGDGEDHVALELEYMRVLADRSAEVLAEAAQAQAESPENWADPADETGAFMRATRLLRAQRNFMRYHLGAWVPAFTREVERFAQTDFYLGAAKVTRGFVTADAELLDEVLEQRADA